MNQQIPKSKYRVGQKLILDIEGHYDNVLVKVTRKHYFWHDKEKTKGSWGYYFSINGRENLGAIYEGNFSVPRN